MKPFAERVNNIQPSMTVEIDSLAKDLSKDGRSIWNLGVGESNFNTPDHIREDAIKSIKKGLTRYTAPSGMIHFKEAVANKLYVENNLAYVPEQIVATSGAKHAVFNAISALVNAGDEVLIPAPYWVTYPDLVRYCGGVPVFLECKAEHGFRLEKEQIKKAVTLKTKAIILNSPCNPTGVVYSKEELESFAEVIVEKDLYCISDEIYEHLVYESDSAISIATMPNMQERTIVVNGFSKAYCMTGWRIGYLAAPIEIAQAIAKMQGQTTHHPSNISQYGAIAALSGPFESVIIMKQELAARMFRVCGTLESIPEIRFSKAEGAFYIFADVSAFYGKKTTEGTKITNSIEFCKALLDEHSVVIMPGVAFGRDSCVRISFTASLPTLSVAMPRFRDFVEGLK